MSSADQMVSTNQRRVVLVADDNDAVLELASRVIEGMDFVALKASDGAAALEFAIQCRALLACVILDIQMPLMNGIEAAQAIQQTAPELAIVLMSGAMPLAQVNRIRQIRTFALLQKPFQLSELRDVIRQASANSIAIGGHTIPGAAGIHGKQRHYE